MNYKPEEIEEEKMKKMEKLMDIVGIDQFLNALLRSLSSEELESFAAHLYKNFDIEEEDENYE